MNKIKLNDSTKIFLLPLIIKALLVLVSFFYLKITGYYQNLNVWDYFYKNDSGWYEFIFRNGINLGPNYIENGWRTTNQHTAFFPLYPGILKSINFVIGGDFKLLGNFLSLLSASILALVFYNFVNNFLKDKKVAFNASVILMLNPFSLHFYALYTESLYLILFLSCLNFILKKQWWQFVLISSLLVLSRPNGVFTSIILGMFILEQSDSKLNWKKLINPFTWLKENKVWILIPMILTFIGYLFYLKFATGDAFSFANAQNAWYKKTMFPLFALFSTGFWQNQFNSVYTLLIMIVAFKLRLKLPFSFNVLIWISILLPLAAGSTTSMTRYISVIFPLYYLMAQTRIFKNYKKPILAFFSLGLAVMMLFWLNSNAISY